MAKQLTDIEREAYRAAHTITCLKFRRCADSWTDEHLVYVLKILRAVQLDPQLPLTDLRAKFVRLRKAGHLPAVIAPAKAPKKKTELF